jgi:hypothetical protein
MANGLPPTSLNQFLRNIESGYHAIQCAVGVCDDKLKTPIPLTVVADDRKNYDKRRDFVQEKRYGRNCPVYTSIEEALSMPQIDFGQFLSTPGGHDYIMKEFIAFTSLPLIVVRGRQTPMLLVNTKLLPVAIKAFHTPVTRENLVQSTEFDRPNVLELQVKYPTDGESFSYIAECDTMLPFFAFCARTMSTRSVCIYGCDGDYIVALMLAGMDVSHVWPSTAGTLTTYNMARLLRRVPVDLRASIATLLYLFGGSDFGPYYTPMTPAACIAIILIYFNAYVVPDKQTGRDILPAIRAIHKNLEIVDPSTWQLDKQKLDLVLREMCNMPKSYYLDRMAEKDIQKDPAKELTGRVNVIAFNRKTGQLELGTKEMKVKALRIVSARKSDGMHVEKAYSEWTADRCIKSALGMAEYLVKPITLHKQKCK